MTKETKSVSKNTHPDAHSAVGEFQQGLENERSLDIYFGINRVRKK